MNILKKWLPTGLLATAGILAIVLGFIAGFGTFSPLGESKTFADSYNNTATILKDALPTIVHHVGMAFIGGLITASLGIVALATAGFTGYKAYKNEMVGNKIVLAVSIFAFVALISLAIGAFICNVQLNDSSWIHESFTKDLKNLDLTDTKKLMGIIKAVPHNELPALIAKLPKALHDKLPVLLKALHAIN